MQTTDSTTLATVADTEAFGASLGKLLDAGDLVLLSGPLGAGKTVLVRGIAQGMGVHGRVNSPTFVLARVHGAPEHGVPLIHVDAYRLSGLDELDDLDLDTDLTDAVVVVEWGADFAERLADEHLVVRLTRREDDVREVRLEPYGSSWTQRLAGFAVAELDG